MLLLIMLPVASIDVMIEIMTLAMRPTMWTTTTDNGCKIRFFWGYHKDLSSEPKVPKKPHSSIVMETMTTQSPIHKGGTSIQGGNAKKGGEPKRRYEYVSTLSSSLVMDTGIQGLLGNTGQGPYYLEAGRKRSHERFHQRLHYAPEISYSSLQATPLR